MNTRVHGMSTTLVWLSVLVAMTTSASAPTRGQDTDAAREQLQQRVHADLERQMRDQGFRPTRGNALDQSLEQLLNGGHSIVATQQAPGGHILTLRDRGGQKWVLCILASRPSPDARQVSFDSLCRALN